jgi:predicted enzyme related to lactoylglutathione lyase
MPRHQPAPGAPCWFELASTRPGDALAFYRALFGWTADSMDMGEQGEYTFLHNATGSIGALCGLPPGSDGQPSAWGPYFAVADVDAAFARAQALGGSGVVPPFDAPGHGRGAVIADPSGAVCSLWQSAQADSGNFTMFEDHSIGWVELATRDVAAARAFYGALLGWSFADSPVPIPGGGIYTEYLAGGTRYGGMMAMTAEWGDLPSHWSLYILVPDVDDCLARATALGGSVCVPAFDAPGVGRIARIDDPTGAGFYVIALAARP